MGNVHMEATQINYRGGSKKMSVEEAIKAAGTEITPEEKAWIDTIPELASQEIIAPEFDAEEGVYAVGDLVIYQGGLYQFTTAHETAGAWNAEEVAAVKVSDELDSLKSGLINVDVALSMPNGAGKNRLSMSLMNLKSWNTTGTWIGNAYTVNGVTFTALTDNDGNVSSIEVTGTATSGTNLFIANGMSPDSISGRIMNGCPANGGSDKYAIYCMNTNYGVVGSDFGYGVTLSNTEYNCQVFIQIANGYAIPAGGLSFKPMIRLATITDPAFVPYIPSVEERLEALEAAISQLTNG